MATLDFSQWEMQPRKLSADEIENPQTVIHQFFDYASLPQVRAHLWEWLKSTVTGDYVSLPRQEKGNLIYFFEQLEKLVEAAHIIHEQSKRN